MRRYETFLIIDPDTSKEQRDPMIARVKELITQMDGFLARIDEWGERKLAYEIKKKERGYYVRFDYCGSGSLVNEIERFFRIDDRALKHMTVLLDKFADLEKLKEEMAKAEIKSEAESATDVTEKTGADSAAAEAGAEPTAEETVVEGTKPIETQEEV